MVVFLLGVILKTVFGFAHHLLSTVYGSTSLTLTIDHSPFTIDLSPSHSVLKACTGLATATLYICEPIVIKLSSSIARKLPVIIPNPIEILLAKMFRKK